MKVDFHSHTCESDGTLTPQEISDFMGERGVEMFSISDHDTMSGYGMFTPPKGARVVTGVEVNTAYRENEVHVLGYGMPPDSPQLSALMEHNRGSRLRRAEKMVSQLNGAGYGITIADVMAQAPSAKAIGRPHVAKALILRGEIPDIDYAFKHLLVHGKPGFVPSDYVTPQQAIEAIKGSGGLAVMAHPGRLKNRAILDELAPLLDGLEVFYPKHDAQQTLEYRAVAKRFGLFMTGGNDFHDIRYHERGVGMDIDVDDIKPFIDRVID